MKHITLFFITVSVVLTAGAHAASYYVDEATGSGVNPSELGTVTELVRSAVSEVGQTSVPTSGEADYGLRPRLLRLNGAYVLTLQKIEKGVPIYSSQLKAQSFDEIDKVATRLTRSVIAGEVASKEPRVGEITNQEASDGLQRRPARQLKYLAIAGGGMSNLGASDIGYGGSLGYIWDLGAAALRLVGDAMVQSSALWFNANIGGVYFFSPRDVAPYLGADIGFGLTKVGGSFISGETTAGFVAGLDGGVQLFHTAQVNLDIGIRGAILLNSNSLGHPTLWMAKVGLCF